MSSSSDSDEPQECPLCCEDAPIELPAYETWLQCDICEEWYHGICVGISSSECEHIDKYHCRRCAEKHGPSSYNGPALRRSKRNNTRVDYIRLNEGQPATFNQYLLRLDEHEFLEDEFDHLENGSQVTRDWIRSRDTNDPFIVKNAQGLGMIMPDPSLTVKEIASIIGEDTPVSVMDVLTQEELKGWALGDWANYFHSDDRRRVLNVISLEISGTELDKRIRRPRVVDEIDVVEKYWPESKRKPNRFPKVKTYCLMSVQNAYTDFHVDFSATWVYYHVLTGEKVFYLIPPTPSNMRKFESWSKSPEQAVSLFAEHVKQCFEVRVKAGNTLFIPAGWVHAVFTPVDTIVIGGNFMVMQSLNTHIGVYKLEARTKVSSRYRFPFFIKLCRYMTELLAKKWGKLDKQAKLKWTLSELEGVFALAAFLEDKLLGRGDSEADEEKALGDKGAAKKHVSKLLELVGAELESRMLPEEWVNRELQLREGSHFRWIRPGMHQGSLLLASRPRRRHAANGVNSPGKSMTKIRKKTAERAHLSRVPKLKLVRGRSISGASKQDIDMDNNNNDDNDGDSENGDDALAALGIGSSGSGRQRKRFAAGSDSDSDDTEDSNGSHNDSDAESADSDVGSSEENGDGDEGNSCLSADSDGFIVSDSEGDRKRPKKRKFRHLDSNGSLHSTAKLKGAKQRIAERLKIKL
ncbi:JmjC domain-containing histone demethylation protein 1 [Coemansia asiatica]|uniref:JmjC domain-containing histone demethylation protein 1 n=1 Tax=Coemansia asiatica TaxID=1052880 RepID=A0A9W7XDT9_9FUNG|nr:JmjC domain-containing histone demethylation protein 1 [Coemansia asiatica]